MKKTKALYLPILVVLVSLIYFSISAFKNNKTDQKDSTGIQRKSCVTLCCLKGTPAFMAPEVLQDRIVSVAADVYGFGIILWEMSVASRPFSGLSVIEVRWS